MKIMEVDSLNQEKLFSICTLVTDIEEYAQMVDSFKEAGFSEENCEFIYIDNSVNNKYDAYDGLNLFLNKAQGQYIILCHQDILLRFDNFNILKQRIEEMDKIDENWGLLGNAGYMDFNKIALRITDPWGENRKLGKFPSKVKSVDENFILVKNSANLSLSSDIGGFHLYGTDLCTITNILGYNCYVIDFHLFHKSGGNANETFYANKKRFMNKYKKALRPLAVRTPVTPLFVFPSQFLNWLCNRKICYSVKKRWDYIFAKFK